MCRGTWVARTVAAERRILDQNCAQDLATTFLLIISRGPNFVPRFWAQNRDHISSWFCHGPTAPVHMCEGRKCILNSGGPQFMSRIWHAFWIIFHYEVGTVSGVQHHHFGGLNVVTKSRHQNGASKWAQICDRFSGTKVGPQVLRQTARLQIVRPIFLTRIWAHFWDHPLGFVIGISVAATTMLYHQWQHRMDCRLLSLLLLLLQLLLLSLLVKVSITTIDNC